MSDNVIVVRAKGARGAIGLQGAQGLQGSSGAGFQGVQGLIGFQGIAGSSGSYSPYTLTTNINSAALFQIDAWALGSYTTLEYKLQIKQGSKIRSSKLMVVTNQSLFYYVEYAIIEIGGSIDTLLIGTGRNGSFGEVTIQISDAESNNAQVTIVRSTIA